MDVSDLTLSLQKLGLQDKAAVSLEKTEPHYVLGLAAHNKLVLLTLTGSLSPSLRICVFVCLCLSPSLTLSLSHTHTHAHTHTHVRAHTHTHTHAIHILFQNKIKNKP